MAFPTSWLQRKKVVIDHTKVSGDLLNFPVLINGDNIPSSVFTDLKLGTHSLDLELSSSQYASIAHASQVGLNLTTDFTIEAWIRLEQLPSTAGTAFTIVAKDQVVSNQRPYFFDIDTNNKLRLNFEDSSGNRTRGTCDTAFNSSDVGKWRHVSVTVDISASTMIFYINSIARAVTYTNQAATAIVDFATPFYIGASHNNGTPASFFDGMVKVVRAFSDIRTPAEIASDMNALTVTNANLVGEWILDNAYTDTSGNGNTLTASGSPTFSTTILPAKFGQLRFSPMDYIQDAVYSLDLNGSSQYASISDASQTGLDITGNISMSAWVEYDALPGSGSAMVIAGKRSGLSNNRSYNLHILNNSGTYQIRFGWSADGSAETNHARNFVPVAGAKMFISIRFTAATHTTEFFLNGVLIGSDSSGSATSIFSGAAAFYIGTRGDGSGNPELYHNGKVKCVRVFNDLRTDEEMLSDMYEFGEVTDANLQGEWLLENNYNDTSGNGNNLTASGSPSFVADVPTKELPFEIVDIDPVAETAEIWVRVPKVFDSVNTVIYMWYGNPDAPAVAPWDTWGQYSVWLATAALWTLESTLDKTANANNLTLVNSPVHAAGMIGNGLDLELSSNQGAYAVDSSSLSITGSISIKGFIKFESLGAVDQEIVGRWETSATKRSIQFMVMSTGKIRVNFSSDGTVGTVATTFESTNVEISNTGVFYQIAFTLIPSSDTCVMIVNGVSVAVTKLTDGSAASIYDSDHRWVLGNRYNATVGSGYDLPLDGVIDQIGIYASILSTNWFATEYENANSPATFLTISESQFVEELNEIADVEDTISKALPSKTYSDLAIGSDSISTLFVQIKEVVDNISQFDLISKLGSFVRSIVDTVTGDDEMDHLRTLRSSKSDDVDSSDMMAQTLTFGKTLDDVFDLRDRVLKYLNGVFLDIWSRIDKVTTSWNTRLKTATQWTNRQKNDE